MVSFCDVGCSAPLFAPRSTRGRTGCRRAIPIMTTANSSMVSRRDGRQIARDNEIRVLRALHRFGWLRTRDLGGLCWTRWATRPTGLPSMARVQPSASAIRMAQRTLRRLDGDRLIISAQAPDGSTLHALSEGGSRALKDAGISAVSGKDLVRNFSSAYFRHRCISNEIAIAGLAQGFRVSTEREVAQGAWLGGVAGIAGKRPDVLLRGGGQVSWCEVERSRKNAKDYTALLTWLGVVLRDKQRPGESQLLGLGLTWARVIFICTPAFRDKLRRDLHAAGWLLGAIESLLCFETELYRFEDILFP